MPYGIATTRATPTVLGLAYRKPPTLRTLTSISNLVAWYDFGDPTTLFTDTSMTTKVVNSGDLIAVAKDLSGAAHNASNTGATDRPSYQANTKNARGVAQFDGSNDYLLATSFSLVQPETIFIVARPAVTNSTNNALFDGTGTDTMEMRENGSNAFDIYAGSFLTQTLPVDTVNFHIYCVVFNGGSSSVSNNGTSFATGNVGSNNAGGINLARYGGGTRFLQTQIAEFACYNKVLTADETANALNYLNNKWGIY